MSMPASFTDVDNTELTGLRNTITELEQDLHQAKKYIKELEIKNAELNKWIEDLTPKGK